MDTSLPRSFLVILEERSLNRAAVRLRLSQSTLTRQMQALERELGGRLLERSSAGVAPTAAGLNFADSMRRVLADFDAALDEARREARGQRVRLRVGYLLSAGRSFLNPALAALRKAHPEVQVKLLDLSPGEQLQALRRGEIDVALIGQEGAIATREFYTRKIATLPVDAVLPSHHPLAHGDTVRLIDLRDLPFIGAPDKDVPGRNSWITQLCRRAGFRPRIIEDSESLAHALSLVVSENAVILTPNYTRDLPAAGIAMVPLAESYATWDLLVVWQRGRVPASVRTLIDAFPKK
jgi:DNA-binding transcriptional LysR family regulator